MQKHLINSVNCMCVIGRGGIALQFKNTSSENFQAYTKACKQNEVQPGKKKQFTPRQIAIVVDVLSKKEWMNRVEVQA